MDIDYNTVKYLIIILSLLILGYVIFIIYNDLDVVRGECNKLKNKLIETSDSLTELNKQLEYDDDEDDFSEISKNNKLDDIFNYNFFNSSSDINNEQNESHTIEDSNNFNLNIPLFTEDVQNKITEVSEVPEEEEENVSKDTYKQSDDNIQFIKTKKKCVSILSTGKNKGNQCTKDSVVDSDYCLKHSQKL